MVHLVQHRVLIRFGADQSRDILGKTLTSVLVGTLNQAPPEDVVIASHCHITDLNKIPHLRCNLQTEDGSIFWKL